MKTGKNSRPRRTGVTKAQLHKIALSFPGASEGSSYGKPAFLVGAKFFTRLRNEDNSLALIVGSIDERDMLLESDPELFHITEHYRDYPAVLARMAFLDAATLQGMLERRWRAIAPKKLVREREATGKQANPAQTRSTRKTRRR